LYSMIKFIQYINESKDGKNTHLEHIEDLVFNEGVVGTRRAINFLRNVRDMLSGSATRPIDVTTKWDGAPAIFAGIDPADGKFFVAKKGLFNVEPQMFKSVEEVNQSVMSSELKNKFSVAYTEFRKLGIKRGVYQGDMMFTKEDIFSEDINGEKFITFQPNTIVYAVPAASNLAREIRKAKIGVVWHTTYTGDSIQSMSASFGKGIVNRLNATPTVWMDDATYKDLSGTATMTASDTKNLTAILSMAGKIFQRMNPDALNSISKSDDFLIRLKAFNNSKVRQGKMIVSASRHVQELVLYFKEYYQKEADKRKTAAAKKVIQDKVAELMKYFDEYQVDLIKIYEIVILLTKAKEIVVNQLNKTSSLSTFIRTTNGFQVTSQEGYVAIDHIAGAVKLVDRMEFSKANFSPDVIKGWQR
jgi:hypothetical protein